MPPWIASFVFAIGIAGLFWLNRNREIRTSLALWIPALWVSIAGSRMVSQWLQLAPPSSADVYLEGSPLDRNILTGLMVIALAVLAGRMQKVIALLRGNASILLFFFYCAVSVIWSDYSDVAFKRWTKAVGDLMMIFIVLTDSEPVAALKRLLTRVGFVLLPVSVLFIKYYPDLGRGYSPWEGKVGYMGVATDKNMLGMLCLVLGLGSLWCFLEALKDRKRTTKNGPLLAQGVLLTMTLWLLWMANSSTSTSCFLLGGGLMVLVSMPAVARRPVLVHFLIGMVVLTSFSAVFLNLGLTAAVGRDSTLTGRTEIWASALSLVSNPLFGTGFESFWLGQRLEKIWSIYWFHPIEAHNGYLEVFLNLGWTGIALLAVVLFRGYRNAIAAFHQDPRWGGLRLAFFVVAVTYNFTEAAFKTMNLVWIAFLLAITFVPGPFLLGVRNISEESFPLRSNSREPETELTEVISKRPTPAFER